MLTLLNISNLALIDEMQVEFESGLNLLTGETGSGKSIIVDALGLLIGARFTSAVIKSGSTRAFVEGEFQLHPSAELDRALAAAGIEFEDLHDRRLFIRREFSSNGRNRIFINNHLATQSLLRQLQPFLVDIHGQGDQQTLFDADTHLELLDAYAMNGALREEVAGLYEVAAAARRELEEQKKSEAERFQRLDLLRFQITELERAELQEGEDARLDEERRRLTNVEKLTTLSDEAYNLIYEDTDSALARIEKVKRRVQELAEFDSDFAPCHESLQTAGAVLEDLSLTLRGFRGRLEFSPARLAEVEDRLAELARLKRKYGGTIEAALEHLADSREKLGRIEHADERERELREQLEAAEAGYREAALRLNERRRSAARKFDKAVERGLAEVALESARFSVEIISPKREELESGEGALFFTSKGIDRVEFMFSANVGEALKPLARVASGGEASRLMLVLKTVAGAREYPRTIVFDEIDQGIGGRASDAVGAKLKRLSESNQVLCVTHQAQIARFADSHLLVSKAVEGKRTRVSVDRLDRKGRVEEIARMLTGAEITESARRHARELLS